jgi:hypothetical protein
MERVEMRAFWLCLCWKGLKWGTPDSACVGKGWNERHLVIPVLERVKVRDTWFCLCWTGLNWASSRMNGPNRTLDHFCWLSSSSHREWIWRFPAIRWHTKDTSSDIERVMCEGGRGSQTCTASNLWWIIFHVCCALRFVVQKNMWIRFIKCKGEH